MARYLRITADFSPTKGNVTMFQVRIHGRGGQGVVTAAEILSVAAFDEGRYAQAFPSFGSERTGAPVVSFCRIDDREIRSREPVMEPNAVIIQDVTLIHQVDLFAGLSPEGYVLINTSREFSELGFGNFFDEYRTERLMTCPATDIALDRIGRPFPNAALLGGFAALTGEITLDAIDKAVREHFVGPVGERNAAAAAAAFDYVASKAEEVARASTN
jgi:pyruvate ferredoxin oxidoreductase gamma subunit